MLKKSKKNYKLQVFYSKTSLSIFTSFLLKLLNLQSQTQNFLCSTN